MPEFKITKETFVSIGLVITLVFAGVSFGVMYQRVDDMGRRLVRVEDKIDKLVELRLTQTVSIR